MAWKRTVLAALGAIGIAGAGSAETLSVGLADGSGGIGAAPLVVGVSGHRFFDAGADVALTGFADDASVEAAVADGRAAFGAVRLDGAFFAYAASHGLTIIAPEWSDQTGYPGTALLISEAAHGAGLRDPRALVHRRIGLTAPDALERFQLAEVLRRYGIAPGSVELVWLGTEAKQLWALAEGSVDAVAVPFATAFEHRRADRGAAVIRLSDYAQAQGGVIVTRAETIRTRRADVEAFMRGYRAAVADYDLTFQQRDDGGGVLPGAHFGDDLAAMARQAGLAPTLLAYALPYCDHLARLDMDDLGRQLRFWQQAGMVPAGVMLGAIVDLSFNSEHIGSSDEGRKQAPPNQSITPSSAAPPSPAPVPAPPS